MYVIDNEQFASLQIDFTHYLPLRNALKPCFGGDKSIGLSIQKMMFYKLKAMFLPSKIYVFGKLNLFFDQINESFSLFEESNL